MTFVERIRWGAWIAAGLLSCACADKAGHVVMDAGDTESDTGTDTGSDTGTGSEVDTGEDETPPDLPALCDAGVFNAVASGEGDARSPAVAGQPSLLAGWMYDPQETDQPEQWLLQAGACDPLGTGPTVNEPFTPAAVGQGLALAASADGFGAVWLDSRWDAECAAAGDPDSCIVDVAYTGLDANGVAPAAEPVRITTTGVDRHAPAIAATPTGWLVTWMGSGDGNLRATAAPVAADGTAGAASVISGSETFFEGSSSVSIAAGPAVAVAVWTSDMSSVTAQAVGFDGAPVGAPVVVDDGVECSSPRVAASDEGFLVTWSRRSYEDFEVYSLLLDGAGLPVGEANRLTWTTTNATGSAPAWNGSAFGVVWLSDRANGAAECVESECKDQLFGSMLDADGALASVPVLLSDNPNPSSAARLSWDGGGWSAFWEVRRNMRQEVYRGRFTCD